MNIAANRLLPSWRACLVTTGLLAAPAALAQDFVVLEDQVGPLAPGSQVIMPLYVRDVSGTLLGLDVGPSFTIQGLAVNFEFSPASAIDTIDVERAGITAALSPLFETEVSAGNRHSWIVTFDDAPAPVPFTLDIAAPGDLVAELRITLAADLPPDTLIRVAVVAPTALGNQPPGLPQTAFTETAANGFLSLSGGTLIPASYIFVDGFESGDTSAW